MKKRGAGRPVAPLRDRLHQLSNPQVPTAVTKPASCATRISPRGPSLAFGQFTLCRACVELPICVAVRNPALRRVKEMGAHCAPLR